MTHPDPPSWFCWGAGLGHLLFISNYFCLYFLSLECIQVHNGTGFSVVRSKTSQLGDVKERQRGEEGREQGGSSISAVPWLDWACWGMVMPSSSPATEALVCSGPLLTGLRVWHCLELQDPLHLHLPRARGLRGSRTSMSQRRRRQEQWRVNFCMVESNDQMLRKSALALGCEMVSGRVKVRLICLFLNCHRGQSTFSRGWPARGATFVTLYCTSLPSKLRCYGTHIFPCLVSLGLGYYG